MLLDYFQLLLLVLQLELQLYRRRAPSLPQASPNFRIVGWALAQQQSMFICTSLLGQGPTYDSLKYRLYFETIISSCNFAMTSL